MERPGINCKIGLIHPEEIPNIWPHVYDHIEACSPHSEGELETKDFYYALVDADMQLWVAIELDEVIASMITQFITYPRKKVLRVITVGGSGMDKWMPFMSELEHFATMTGCSSLEAWGRKGWKKILPDWKDSYVVYTKDLKYRMH